MGLSDSKACRFSLACHDPIGCFLQSQRLSLRRAVTKPMEDADHSELALAFPDPEEALLIIEHFENDFFSRKYTSSGNCQPAILFLAQSETNVAEA